MICAIATTNNSNPGTTGGHIHYNYMYHCHYHFHNPCQLLLLVSLPQLLLFNQMSLSILYYHYHNHCHLTIDTATIIVPKKKNILSAVEVIWTFCHCFYLILQEGIISLWSLNMKPLRTVQVRKHNMQILISLYSVINWVRVVLKKTVVGYCRFDKLSRSHESSVSSEDDFHTG